MNYTNSRANQLLLTHEQSLSSLKASLLKCNKVSQREYINRRGEKQFYLEFEFPNGNITQSITPTQEVVQLLTDFLQSEGMFKRDDPSGRGNAISG